MAKRITWTDGRWRGHLNDPTFGYHPFINTTLAANGNDLALIVAREEPLPALTVVVQTATGDIDEELETAISMAWDERDSVTLYRAVVFACERYGIAPPSDETLQRLIRNEE